MSTLTETVPEVSVERGARGIDAQAQRLADQAAARVLDAAGQRPPVMVVRAVAGAGKTELVADLASQQVRAGESVVVATCTREQAVEVCERLVRRGLVPVYTQGQGSQVPARVAALGDRVRLVTRGRDITPTPGEVVVGNVAKLAHLPASPDTFDLMIVDEAFQLRNAEFLPAHTLAARWVLVGDPAQLPPFTPALGPEFQGSPAVVSAAASVIARNPTAQVLDLPVSRRLPADTSELIGRLFYPDVDMRSLTENGVRKLVPTPLSPAPLQALRTGSVVLAELPGPCSATDDVDVLEQAADLARQSLGHVVMDEHGAHCLQPDQVVVLAGRHTQVGTLRRLLHGTGIDATTFNRAQGRTFDLTIVVDPLVSGSALPAFALDPGRLAVALTRHRIGVVIVSRRGVRDVLESGIPQDTGLGIASAGESHRALAIHAAIRCLNF